VAGSEVTVAIIDSGVHAAHPHVGGVAGGVAVDDTGRLQDDFLDRLGHGTAVAAVIREKAPAARLLAVRVFDRELAATGIALVRAIEWAHDAGAQIVNLSLGTTNAEHEAPLRTAVDAAQRAGIVVVAAAPDTSHRWLPGALPGVVRVTMDTAIPRMDCRASSAGGEIVVAASGYPRPIPGVPVERNLKGLSFAVANVSGLLAQAWPEWRSALLPRSDKSL
jgi:subtilisin family serine protease